MPTIFALDTLIQTSENKRIRQHVKELYICCSIYQDCKRKSNLNNSSRRLQEDELPFENASTPAQGATNETIELVRHGRFEKRLIIALRNLNITHMTVYDYRGPRKAVSALKPGWTQLVQHTGRVPFTAAG
ncbi:hypothetical protein M436DRAFT_63416 [Aureobasidium namibiae CBS 147.97]|uniref:Uncharacterized protein n=1 Tax=Aureobasidium namibiae CBS 147.97 TaxID=1043004 RepID=A0A074XHP1_9PEZI|nr:uncharacterized protein M436DRAFT_63416 [Aureobasidium namibiae CBS 147.97]KEQ74081.1 hypothetical protein M436DRAFT_63416 [Aureobasidium namibiae CBS 147.97]